MRIAATGLTGLVGSSLQHDLLEMDWVPFDRSSGVDLLQLDSIDAASSQLEAELFLHCAAFTNVNKAWEDRGNKEGDVWRLNVDATEKLLQLAEQKNIPFVFISTAFVFDGEKQGLYLEEDLPHPIEWYGETKHEAERLVQAYEKGVIVRIDQPFRYDLFPKKPDNLHLMVQKLKDGTLHPPFSDHFFSPTNLHDLARYMRWIFNNPSKNIYHASSNRSISDFELARMIQDFYAIPGEIQEGSLRSYLETSSRPYQKNTALSSEKIIKASGIQPSSLEDALGQLVL